MDSYAHAAPSSSAAELVPVSVADIAKQHSKHMALLGEGGAVAAGAEEDVEMPLMPGGADPRQRQPPWRRRSNLVLLGCMGTLLVVLVVAVAVSSAHPRTGHVGATMPPPGPPPAAPPYPPADRYQAPTPTHDYLGRPRRVRARGGVVAADQGTCAAVGAEMLAAGGTAADAAVATSLCQGVMNPFASGVGGGFFAVVRGANGTADFIDARETAPAAASWDMYQGMPWNASVDGGLAVAVPLELKGLELLWRRWGRLPWSRLVLPSARLAQSGFPAYPYLVYMLDSATQQRRLQQYNSAEGLLVPDGPGRWRAPRVGELCCSRPALARTLSNVAEHGAAWLYQPERAAALAAEIRAAGGIMTAQDLMSTQPFVGPPLRMKVGEYDVLLPPPPSSAAVMGLALRILWGYGAPPANTTPALFSNPGAGVDAGQLLYQHRMVEAYKEAFALRLSLGDPGPPGSDSNANISDIMRDILDPQFADLLRSDLRDAGVLNVTEYGRQWNPYANRTGGRGLLRDDHGTSHITVVDGQRNAVSLTTTINGGFGSAVTSPSTGILLNNEMDDFSRPDLPNAYGLAPSPSNFIAPGRRPLSSMSPTVVTKDGKLVMVVGASNGPRIITATLQAIVRVLLYGWDVLDAVSAPRVHHQLLPLHVKYESFAMPPYAGNLTFNVSRHILDYLVSKGNALSPEAGQLGNAQIAYLPPDGDYVLAASDPRKDGAPAAAPS